MEASELTEEQKRIIRASSLCQEQLAKILDDRDLEKIEQCYLELNMVEFNLGEAIEAVLFQTMDLSRKRQVPVVHDSPTEVSVLYLYGDNLRLQQVLSDFLLNALLFTPEAEGSVVIRIIPMKKNIGSGLQIVHLEIRIIHPPPGIPESLVQEMFHQSPGVSKEGLGLYISQNLVKIMNGTVQYLRAAKSSSFIILLSSHAAVALALDRVKYL
ncbi:hypothetical protein HPP92_013595 [Vanilla planifolia]|uniref:histidine kinase n=1 Tax=Vanilla planifolia TaxID=51239 RepID=A0A835QXA7_VANPL|nr:hypothetical protein HPP92_013595 [Vanilla planifolia]